MCTIVSLTGETVIKPLASIIDYLVNKPVEDSPLNDIARQIGALQRQGSSFNFAHFTHAALNFVGFSGSHQQSYHLENCRIAYNRICTLSM